MSSRRLYLVAIIVIIIWTLSISLFLEATRPPSDYQNYPFNGPWTDPEYPTGTGWLIYPNGGEAVNGAIIIRWDTRKTPKLEHDNTIWIVWSHEVRGAEGVEWPPPQEVFRYEDWEGYYCSKYHLIADSAPNNGEYVWNATQALELYGGEWYPYYIKIMSDRYMDASNSFFNITG